MLVPWTAPSLPPPQAWALHMSASWSMQLQRMRCCHA